MRFTHAPKHTTNISKQTSTGHGETLLTHASTTLAQENVQHMHVRNLHRHVHGEAFLTPARTTDA